MKKVFHFYIVSLIEIILKLFVSQRKFFTCFQVISSIIPSRILLRVVLCEMNSINELHTNKFINTISVQ